MKFYTISLFPNTIENYVQESILGRAQKNKLIKVSNFQLRDFTKDKHRRTDGIPYGGGPGMVLWIDPVINTFEKILKEIFKDKKKLPSQNNQLQQSEVNKNILIINFIPNIKSAKNFTNILAKEYAKKYSHIIFLCARYEGLDARINLILKDILTAKKKEVKEKNKETLPEKSINPSVKQLQDFNFKIENISIGDFVLTGGEIPAMLLIDAISRQITGVLNKNESLEENRITSHKIYARPEIYEKKINQTVKKYRVPKVLLSGHHKKIEEWRAK